MIIIQHYTISLKKTTILYIRTTTRYVPTVVGF